MPGDAVIFLFFLLTPEPDGGICPATQPGRPGGLATGPGADKTAPATGARGGAAGTPANGTMRKAVAKAASIETFLPRFSSRAWGVNLSVNEHPINHTPPRRAEEVGYWPRRGDAYDSETNRFAEAVEEAAAASLRGPVVFHVNNLEDCDELVLDWLTVLLETGDAMSWCDGSTVKMNTANLVVNLWLRPTDPATPALVDRLVGYQGSEE